MQEYLSTLAATVDETHTWAEYQPPDYSNS